MVPGDDPVAVGEALVAAVAAAGGLATVGVSATAAESAGSTRSMWRAKKSSSETVSTTLSAGTPAAARNAASVSGTSARAAKNTYSNG